MDLKEIQNLIKFVSKSEVAEVNLKMKEFEIKIKNTIEPNITYAQPPMMQAAPIAQTAAQTTVETTATETPQAVTEDSKYLTIKSPMIGTFYRASGPGKEPFVNVGDNVAVGSVICIVEAMKLFNEIEAEVSGKIVKILVDDSSPIEYDQPLFLIDPS